MPEIRYEEGDIEFLVNARDSVPELSEMCPGNDLRDADKYHGRKHGYAGGESCECAGSELKYVARITLGKVLSILVRLEAVTINSFPYAIELSSRAATVYIGDTIEEAAIAALVDTIR